MEEFSYWVILAVKKSHLKSINMASLGSESWLMVRENGCGSTKWYAWSSMGRNLLMIIGQFTRMEILPIVELGI
jgi:hypothetical protein